MDGQDRSFFSWPRDNKQLSKQWEVAIKKDIGPLFNVSAQTKVCSLHFKLEDIIKTLTGMRKLKPGVVPSVFPWVTEKMCRADPKDRSQIPMLLSERDAVFETEKVETTCEADNTPGDDLGATATNDSAHSLELHSLTKQMLKLEQKLQEKDKELNIGTHKMTELKNEKAKTQRINWRNVFLI